MKDEKRAEWLLATLAFYDDFSAPAGFVEDRMKVVGFIESVRAEHAQDEQLTIRRVLEAWDLTRDGGIGQLAEAIAEALQARRAPGGK